MDPNEELLATDEREKFLKEMKSFYYHLNAKPDSITKVYKDKVIIDLDSIFDLHDRITSKLKLMFINEGLIASITVSLSNRNTINFECWEEFEQHKWNEGSHIKNITITWDFLVKLPRYEYPQRHKLVVKLSSGLRPEEVLSLILTGKIEDMEDLETNEFPIIAQMDFIQTQLGEEFLNIVTDWVSSLKKVNQGKSKLILFLRKHRKKVAVYFNYVISLFIFALGVAILNKYIKSFNVEMLGNISLGEFANIINIVACIIVVSYISLNKFESVAKGIFESLYTYGSSYLFSITNGDKNKQLETENEDKKNAKAILIKVIFSLIFNVVCGIITTVLTDVIYWKW